MKSKSIYYDVSEDLAAYPDAWCYIIVGGRNTGKTYGALMHYLKCKEPNVFVKRTNKDIELLCAGNHIGDKAAPYEIDLSPYKSINRDTGEHIKAFKIDDGLGAFFRTNDEGCADGKPVAYLVSLFAVSKYKGFDLAECPAVIFDEFIPQPWDRINRREGEQLMDLYKTVARDRYLRGFPELKLICLANAVNVFNYTSEVLEVTDIIADMTIHKREVTYLEDRGIFIRILETSEEMMAAEQKTGIYRAMAGTAWGRMAFGNEFAYNDFSNVGKLALKGYRPEVSITHKTHEFYIYSNGDSYYMTTSRANCPESYDLNKEMEQKSFWYNWGIDLLSASIDGRMKFEKYTMYDLIVNYKKRFVI